MPDSNFSPLMSHETCFATKNVLSPTMLHPLADGTSGMSIFEKSKISAVIFLNLPFCGPTYPAMCHDESVHTGSGRVVVIPHK